MTWKIHGIFFLEKSVNPGKEIYLIYWLFILYKKLKFYMFSTRKWLFDMPPEDPDYNPLPEEERPGGFNWGEGVPAGGVEENADNNQEEGR